MNVIFTITRTVISTLFALLIGCGGSSGTTSDATNNNGTNANPTDTSNTPVVDSAEVVVLPTEIVQPSPASTQPARENIENLFGQVQFNYRFGDFSNEDYSISFNFDATSEVDPILGLRTLITEKTGTDGYEEILSCTEYLIYGDFYCLYADLITEDVAFIDMFVISMTSQLQGSGNFESCLFSTIEECSNDVLFDPDGTVDFSITRTTRSAYMPPTVNDIPTTVAEIRDFKMASKLQQAKEVTLSKTPAEALFLEQLGSALLKRLW